PAQRRPLPERARDGAADRNGSGRGGCARAPLAGGGLGGADARRARLPRRRGRHGGRGSRRAGARRRHDRSRRRVRRGARGAARLIDPTEATPLGGTGLTVTRVGLGTAALGGLYEAVTDEAARATIDRAWEVGVRFFDTAPLYGHGTSEQRVGAALSPRPRDE